jgi:protein-L-isoaspartate(D-aspartate) O-methyltransferase
MGAADLNKDALLEKLRDRVSERVVEAMARTPRELFVPDHLRAEAYYDHPLHIGWGQTISAPHMVAIMCEVLDLKEGMKVLEVGGGSGYHAAVMAELVGPDGHVYAVERIAELAREAMKNLSSAGYSNVTVIVGDGSCGLPEYAPYDRISVACAAPDVPEPLKEQLKKGGKLVVPVGSQYQELLLVTKKNGFEIKRCGGVIFVPLIGSYGFKG